MSKKKRFISMLLAMTMVFQLAPIPAFAAQNGSVTISSNVLKGSAYHTVTFMNGEKVVATQFVQSGASLVMPEAPSQEGYRFAGWFAGETQITADTLVSADMTVTAKLVPIGRYTFTVHYVDMKGHVVGDDAVRSYTEDDELPMTEEGVKYVTIQSPPEAFCCDNKLIFPKQYYVTFYLNGDYDQEQTVLYDTADTTYYVMHMAMGKVMNDDGTVSFNHEDATLLERETLEGVAGMTVAPEGKEIPNYIYDHSHSLTLSDKTPHQFVNVYYKPVQHVVRFDTQGGGYLAPHHAYHGDSVPVYTMHAGEGYICGIIGHTHGDDCYMESRGRKYLVCRQDEHVHNADCAAPETYYPTATRQGYEFAGWYSDPECSIEAPQTIAELSSDVTVYAKWVPAQANYTVVYMQQVYNNSTGEKEYVYYGSRVQRGNVGETTGTPNAAQTPTRSYRAGESTATITADGSAVATVYYNLTVYTLNFNLNNSSASMSIGGNTHTGAGYSFSCVLGQNVSGMWPGQERVTSTDNYKFYGWDHPEDSDHFVTNRYEVTEDMLPSSGTSITYTGIWEEDLTNKFVGYWLQDVNGQYYELSSVYSQAYVSNGTLSAKQIFGFTYEGATKGGSDASGNPYPDSGDEYTYNGKRYSGSVVSQFYYRRNQFNIDYYVNQEKTTRPNVYFGANINTDEYKWIPNSADYDMAADYVFAGWFDNAECLGTPYNFTTMPGNNLVLYAKFTPPVRTVTMIFQDGETEHQTAQVPLGGYVKDLPIPTREDYTFIGWYTATDGGDAFDPLMPITENMNIYAHWRMNNLKYTVRYVEKDTGKELAPSKVVSHTNLHLGDLIEENALSLPGYRQMELNKSINLVLNPDENVITFNYVASGNIRYTVYYYLDGTATPIREKKEAISAAERVTEFAPANLPYNGRIYYPTEEVRSIELYGDETKNVIIFYYLPYRMADVQVEFYYDNVLDSEKTRTIENVVVGDSVAASTYAGDPAYTENGLYKLESAEPSIVTVQESDDGQLLTIRIYFVTNEADYTINHYLLGTTVKVAESTSARAVIGQSVIVSAVSGEGEYAAAAFNSFDSTGDLTALGNQASLKISADAGKNVVNVFYTLPLTVKANSAVHAYDGTVKDVKGADGREYTVSGLLTGDEVTVTVAYSPAAAPIDAGSYTVTPAASGYKGYYVLTPENGTLIINKNTNVIIITANSNEKPYDGTALTDSGYTWTQGILAAGDKLEAVVEGSQTNAGSSANVVTSYKVLRGEADVTANYTFGESVNGTLTVTKRTVVLTSASDSKPYDGTPLTNDTVTETGDGFAAGEGAEYDVTGSQTYVGSSENTFAYTLKEGTLADNYTISTALGTLTVTGDSIIPGKSTPAVQSNYGLGDRIPFTIRVQNVRDEAITNVVVTDHNAVILSGAGYSVSADGHTATIAVLGVGETVSISAAHTVTEQDIIAGTVGNTASVTWGDEVCYPSASTDMIEDVDVTMPVTKVSNIDAGDAAAIGQTITYTITVRNEGNVTFNNLIVTDHLSGVQLQPGSGYTVNGNGAASIAVLGIGEEVTLTASYVVTEQDIVAGRVYNLVTVQGSPVDEKTPEGSADVTDLTEEVDLTLDVDKSTLGVQSGGGYEKKDKYTLGDVIWYEITVTNSGNVTYRNVEVRDDNTGMAEIIDALVPGQSASFRTSMAVTMQHMHSGVVYNAATASGETGDPDKTPEGSDDETNYAEKMEASLNVVKTELGMKSGSGWWKRTGGYVLHDEVYFRIAVTNTGNVNLKNVRVADERADFVTTIPVLQAGETASFIVCMRVTVHHVMIGYLYNEVTARGQVDVELDPSLPMPADPYGWDDVSVSTQCIDYTVPMGRTVMNVGDCFE